MPYNIVPYKSGYRLQLKSNPKHIFSNNPMTYENARKQMQAIEIRKHSGSGDMLLHTVIIKKPIEIKKAIEISKKFIPENRNYYRETNDSYRFRNIPKTKFKTFRSKVINDYITLVYGEPIEIGGISKEEILNQRPSAYRSMQMSKYGIYRGTNKGKLKQWIDEKWLNLNALFDKGIELPCGKKYEGQKDNTVCRPKYMINESTPKPLAYQLSKEQVKEAIKLKNKNQRINWKKIYQ